MHDQTIRIEKDSLGEVQVPIDALYGAQTVRAMENFRITGRRVNDMMYLSLAKVKKACALANYQVTDLSKDRCDAIMQACDEIIEGKHKEAFITDAIQGGAGTSMNMNVNEVIANRAAQILNKPIGVYDYIHPNDHVNRAQSTNDIIPTAGKLTAINLGVLLLQEMDLLSQAFEVKAKEYGDVIKVGRTHLQDAVLITMGQVFHSYVSVIQRDMKRLQNALTELQVINLGATAVGTGINSIRGYREFAVTNLSKFSGRPFVSADDLVDATKHVDSFAYVHGSLNTFAIGLSRVCNDIRMMASGPKVGFNEINLPDRQPGSSIMPGKVNPVIPEVVNQVCFQVIGNNQTIMMATESGQMELNVFGPVLFYNLFESFEILKEACRTLRVHAIDNLTVNKERVHDYVEHSLAMATALVKYLGYSKVSEITKQALKENKSLRTVVVEHGLMTHEELDKALRPESMITPQ
ncbi:class II fumarate hydratase [Erysipelothrix larvae]|uniref:aspartate ammonia-lyase n=1 Tax=Erysipelothrix larvae TaxID=1514105 RepID=A0A109UHA6_9FIRM|nr:aspartate ammonia-lyase [Erysipelothrix larvae]AMC93947.1 class II fumarate hydratase [Erysipelothrix larvae]